MNHLFIKPLDVLVLRGNKLFADAGSRRGIDAPLAIGRSRGDPQPTHAG